MTTRLFLFSLILLSAPFVDAKTLYCQGSYCLPNKSVWDKGIEVWITKENDVVDMRTVDIGFQRDREGDNTPSRRLHPDGDCYIEQQWRRKTSKSLVGFGICRWSMGDYFIGEMEIFYDYEDGLKPPSIKDGLLSGVYGSDYDFFGNFVSNRGGKKIEKEKFEEYKNKLDNECWYGDCQDGFGVKWQNNKVYAGEWEKGVRVVSYDRLGRRKEDLKYSPQATEIWKSLRKEYGEPKTIKRGYCFTGGCETGYGVWQNKTQVYKGFFKNKKFHGAGNLSFIDGGSYVGQWSGGERDGLGIETDFRGNIEEGNFVRNKKSGTFQVTYRDGSKREVLYRNDEAIAFGEILRPID